MNKIILGIAAAAAAVTAGSAQAATKVISLTDIGTFTEYSVGNTGQTFAGTGFVGLYNNQFAHLFGLEDTFSKTTAQVNVADLLGKTITSASLTYTLLSNFDQTGVVTITGSAGTGALGYSFAAPTTNYGTALGTTLRTNTADVTNLVAAAAAGSSNWLNLFLQDSAPGNWTYTSATRGTYNADSAQVRLTVNYADATGAVPEPATWAMMLLGFGAVGFAMRGGYRRSGKRMATIAA